MPDPATIALLVPGAVSLIVDLLRKAAESGAEEAGKAAATGLLAKLKERFKDKAGGAEALADLERQPTDADAQAALRVQLGKALAGDADLAGFLQDWSGQARAAAGPSIRQTANVQGDGNKVVQIAGSNNSVG